MRAAVITLIAIAACANPDVEVRRTFALAGPHGTELPDHARGEGWLEAGLAEVDADHADVVVLVEFVDGLIAQTGTAGSADRGTNQVFLDGSFRDTSGSVPFTFQLGALAAHEIGHVVLDTPTHTTCGIMANADVLPCAEDLELADTCLAMAAKMRWAR